MLCVPSAPCAALRAPTATPPPRASGIQIRHYCKVVAGVAAQRHAGAGLRTGLMCAAPGDRGRARACVRRRVRGCCGSVCLCPVTSRPSSMFRPSSYAVRPLSIHPGPSLWSLSHPAPHPRLAPHRIQFATFLFRSTPFHTLSPSHPGPFSAPPTTPPPTTTSILLPPFKVCGA